MNRTVDEEEKTMFSCIASGVGSSSFTYQWYHNNNPITGADQQSLIITASLDNSGNYTCSVKNRYGNTSQSEAALLIILSMLLLYLNLSCVLFLYFAYLLDQYCNEITERYDDFTITWNRTVAGATVKAPCARTGLDG